MDEALSDKYIAERYLREWTPEVFTRDTSARNANDVPVLVSDSTAVKFCFYGFLFHVTGSPVNDEYQRFSDRIVQLAREDNHFEDIVHLNDCDPNGQQILRSYCVKIVEEDSK